MARRRSGQALDWKLVAAVAVVPLVLAVALAIVVATRGSSDEPSTPTGSTTTSIPVAERSPAYASFCTWTDSIQEPLTGLLEQFVEVRRELVLEVMDAAEQAFEAEPPPADLPADLKADVEALRRELPDARAKVTAGPDIIEPGDLEFSPALLAALQHFISTYTAQCLKPGGG